MVEVWWSNDCRRSEGSRVKKGVLQQARYVVWEDVSGSDGTARCYHYRQADKARGSSGGANGVIGIHPQAFRPASVRACFVWLEAGRPSRLQGTDRMPRRKQLRNKQPIAHALTNQPPLYYSRCVIGSRTWTLRQQ